MVKEISLPFLDHRDMRGNIIKNGSFRQLKWWDQIHKSKVEDTFSIKPHKNYVVLERTNSAKYGGKVGITQTIDVNVARYRSLVLSLDTWIDFHSLLDTGVRPGQHSGLGELPLFVSIRYQDVNDHLQVWSHGFITETRMLKNTGDLPNVTFLKKRAWHHFDIDLMQDSIRRDSSGRLMPRPKKIMQINVSGKGWDFRSAIGNLKLSRRAARPMTDPIRKPVERSGESKRTHPPSPIQKPGQKRPIRPPTTTPSMPLPRPSGKSPSQQSKKFPVPPARKSSPQPRKGPKPTAKVSSPKIFPSPRKKTTGPKPSPSKQTADSELVPPPQGKLPETFPYDRVYVDASNVAHGVDLKQPRVNNILLIHDKLREMGFETIIIIADASLRHKIDDKKQFEDFINDGMISQAPAKTEADEFIIGFAKQKIGYIVTNDKLDEWRKKDSWVRDNLNKVHIQFMIQEDMVLFVGFPQ